MVEVERRTRREEYSEATQEALVASGRDAFHHEGFQAANVETISRTARVTRGAFYHHFEDKRALFDVVVVALQAEAAAKVQERALTKRRVWDRLYAGLDAYLDACMDGAYARIVVQRHRSCLVTSASGRSRKPIQWRC